MVSSSSDTFPEGFDPVSRAGHGLEALDADPPPELVFAPQYPFSWTLRGARARRLRAKGRTAITRYRIVGSARGPDEIAAVVSFCEAHDATPELC